jgi:NADH-quinone oxidoreductase subunit H
VVLFQSGGFTHWIIFKQPVAFVIFLVAIFAETNRTPFDLPEAEQELAGGYNVEYSSMKFALFFMGEYANMIAVSAMMVTLFLGGWSLPFAGLNQMAGESQILLGVLQIAVFLAKVVVLMGVFIWVRWMWPRFRYDQLMNLGWRVFIPLALANILATAVWLWFLQIKGWS